MLHGRLDRKIEEMAERANVRSYAIAAHSAK
jgi:hypothetical protein